MSTVPFYDVTKSYEDNYEQGPFGDFAQANMAPVKVKDPEPREKFLGLPVNLPFGIPAGPLLNSHFTDAAFRMGFDINVYKTVRSTAWPCNPFPNVLAVHPRNENKSLTPGDSECDEGVLADTRYESPISISNSFGVPSQDPDVWQPDMAKAVEHAGIGQILVGSFQGSRRKGMDRKAYIADHVATARLVKETGAKVIEMNTSCPNEGHNRLLCHDSELVSEICEAVKNEIGDTPLIFKLAYLPEESDVHTMVELTAARGTVQAFATINTVSAKLVDSQGNQALPGEGRDRSGVCGAAIKPAGLAMVNRMSTVRARMQVPFEIIGIGGVTAVGDYAEYVQAGANSVMSATGAMWDAQLAQKIKEETSL